MTKPRIHFITNGVFTTGIAGGDIHFFKMAEGATAAGYEVNYFGGHALAEVVGVATWTTLELPFGTRIRWSDGAIGARSRRLRPKNLTAQAPPNH